jgi:GNAT superfamily N-acetyltransferase
MTPTLRAVNRSDASRLAVLLDQLGYPSQVDEIDARLAYGLGDPASFLLGAELDGRLAGVAALHVGPILEVTGKWERLVALVVDADHRSEGIGRALGGWSPALLLLAVAAGRHGGATTRSPRQHSQRQPERPVREVGPVYENE